MNHSEIVSFLWGVADLIRDTFKRGKYQDVILPLTVLRRVDAVLAPTKEKVLEAQARLKEKKLENPDARLAGVEPYLAADAALDCPWRGHLPGEVDVGPVLAFLQRERMAEGDDVRDGQRPPAGHGGRDLHSAGRGRDRVRRLPDVRPCQAEDERAPDQQGTPRTLPRAGLGRLSRTQSPRANRGAALIGRPLRCVRPAWALTRKVEVLPGG